MKLKTTIDKANILRLKISVWLLNRVIELQDLKILDLHNANHVRRIMNQVTGGMEEENNIPSKLDGKQEESAAPLQISENNEEEQGMNFEDVFDSSALEFPDIF